MPKINQSNINLVHQRGASLSTVAAVVRVVSLFLRQCKALCITIKHTTQDYKALMLQI